MSTFANLLTRPKTTLITYTSIYVCLGLIGNTLLAFVITRDKELDSLFYKLLRLDAILSNLVLLGQFFITGFNFDLWCDWNTLTRTFFNRDGTVHCGKNIISWLALMLWKPLGYAVAEVSGILNLILGVERVFSFYFPIYVAQRKHPRRTFWAISILLFVICWAVYWPYMLDFAPSIQLQNGTVDFVLDTGSKIIENYENYLSAYVFPWKTLCQVLGCIVLNALVIYKLMAVILMLEKIHHQPLLIWTLMGTWIYM